MRVGAVVHEREEVGEPRSTELADDVEVRTVEADDEVTAGHQDTQSPPLQLGAALGQSLSDPHSQASPVGPPETQL